MAMCKDCKGRGQYVGFTESYDCPSCAGRGEIPDWIEETVTITNSQPDKGFAESVRKAVDRHLNAWAVFHDAPEARAGDILTPESLVESLQKFRNLPYPGDPPNGVAGHFHQTQVPSENVEEHRVLAAHDSFALNVGVEQLKHMESWAEEWLNNFDKVFLLRNIWLGDSFDV